MQDGKFHPHTPYKKVKRIRKKKEPFEVTRDGVKIDQQKLIQMGRADVGKRKRHEEMEMEMPIDMSRRERMEWEMIVDSQIVKVKHEMLDGRPITSVRFANGEEWFEFESFDHQEKFMKENNIEADDEVTGEFIEIDHPKIAGFITMESGKVLFGERENTTRMKRDTTVLKEPVTFFEDPAHGYYKVPKTLLIDLGIADKITSSSKRQGDFIFLEEDQDATTLFDALKRQNVSVKEGHIKSKYFEDPNENPASFDFGLCEDCGTFFSSPQERTQHMLTHKAKK